MIENSGVSVRIAGGLGNQMFQYAAARALALRLGVPLTLDLAFFDRSRRRGYGLSALPLAPHTVSGRPGGGRWTRVAGTLAAFGRRLSGRRVRVYRTPHFHVDEAFFALRAPVYLRGHFQSARYFESAAEQVHAELMPPPAADAYSQQIARSMAEQGETAAIHVRRGDYLSNPKNRALFACCDKAYYDETLARLPGGCTVYVFSDDMAWCRANLVAAHQLVFVDGGQPRAALADLWLMSRARHHVIANSSFSWWGAWLAKRGEGSDPARGLTIAPRHWFVDPASDDRDLVPPGWLRL